MEELSAAVRDAGIEVNGWHGGSQAGDDWGESLRHWIDGADLVVLVVTEQALRSQEVLFELGAAKAMKKPILSLLVAKRGEPGHIPFSFASPPVKVESPREAAEHIKKYAALRMTTV